MDNNILGFLVIGVLVVIIGVLVYLVQKKFNGGAQNTDILTIANEEHSKAIQYEREEKLRLEDLIIDLRHALEEEKLNVIRAQAHLTAQQDKLKEQEAHILELKSKLTLEFENIANRLLEEKSKSFSVQTKENMDALLNPLKENIKNFEEKVDKVYKSESAERSKLEGALKEMMEQTKKIQSDANNLTKALKGDNKKQGNWGEVILERVLENSGLEKDREYRIQASHTDESGSRLQPDVIIDLPDAKNIVIDSKLSLVAYERWTNSTDEVEKAVYLKQHIQSIKSHIDGLSVKKYHNLLGINSPDFVLLFMPIESSFSITVQNDQNLFSYAWDKKVVIVSPTTLLATLRTIASIWKVDRQNKHVYEIAAEAGNLYDKFVGFLKDMETVSINLERANKSHQEALKKLHTGSGNITGKIEKIKKLGATANKQIDPLYLENND